MNQGWIHCGEFRVNAGLAFYGAEVFICCTRAVVVSDVSHIAANGFVVVVVGSFGLFYSSPLSLSQPQ